MRTTAVVLVLMALATTASAQTYVSGTVYQLPAGCAGEGCYVTYYAGNSRAVFSVPHDGGTAPIGMTTRTGEGCTAPNSLNISRDKDTWYLMAEIQRHYRTTGKEPHVIVVRPNRKFLDVIMDTECATDGNAVALAAYHTYWNLVDHVKNQLAAGGGMVYDIHGYTGGPDNAQFGFGIPTTSHYAPTDADRDSSSIKGLVGDRSFTALTRYMGTRLRAAGFPAIPSESDWEPKSNEVFWVGAANGRRLGCPYATDRVCSVQIEHTPWFRTSAVRGRYAAALVSAIIGFQSQLGIAP